MAYLNKEQRDQLQAELKQAGFRAANGRLKRIDRKGRLKYFRNAQRTHEWLTKYILAGLGTEVTLVETNRYNDKLGKANRVDNNYDLIDVIVEPTPDNRN